MRNDKQNPPAQPNVRSLKIHRRYREQKNQLKKVPELRLCGEWLRQLGFELGTQVTVTSMPKMLIIRTTE